MVNKNIYYIDPYARYYKKDTASEETIDIGLIEEGNIVSVNSNKNLKLWKLNTTGDNYIWNVVENIPTEKDYVNDTDNHSFSSIQVFIVDKSRSFPFTASYDISVAYKD